jgi:LysM repeat protein
MSANRLSIGLCLGILAVSGCVSPYSQGRQRQQMAEREDILLVREDMRRLEGRIEGLEIEGDRLQDDLDLARRDSGRDTEAGLAALQASLSSLEQRLTALEAARQRDREEILNRVSETVAKLVAKPSTQVRTSKPRASSGYGYEHTVGSGETLSAIAQAYNVTTKAIIEANEIENPDRLRVGQVLFIPE